MLKRNLVNKGYHLGKTLAFAMTRDDPEVAHEKFVENAKTLNKYGLDKFFLDNKYNKLNMPIEVSNAAGFNKNGEIPSNFLYYLGFNRNVVGTVTNESHQGNERPRIERFPETKSIVNRMGLPGIGSKEVAENLDKYSSDSEIPITINLMAKPGKKGDELLKDLEGTMKDTLRFADRFELNISCPNTKTSPDGKDPREEYQNALEQMLKIVSKEKKERELFLKLSPDIDSDTINSILDVVYERNNIDGLTLTNTTTSRNPLYIPENAGEGGASGNAIKDLSMKKLIETKDGILNKGLELKLISCGGINSTREIGLRKLNGASGVQIYTPLVFEGPELLYKTRKIYCS